MRKSLLKKSAKVAEVEEPPTNKMDIIGQLPRELSCKILVNLPLEDIDNAFNCCKTWRQQMSYDFFWKRVYRENFDCEEESNTELCRQITQSYSLRWQGLFMFTKAVECNIRNNIFKERKVNIKSEYEGSCHYFDNHLLIMTSDEENDVFIINSCTGLVERRFPKQNCKGMLKHGDLLIVVTSELHLKIFNLNDPGNSVTSIIRAPFGADFFGCNIKVCQQLFVIKLLHFYLPYYYVLYDMKTQKVTIMGHSMCINCNENTIVIAKCIGITEILDCDLNLLMTYNGTKVRRIRNLLVNDDFIVRECETLKGNYYLSIRNTKTMIRDQFFFRFSLDHISKRTLHLTPNNKLIFQPQSYCLKVWDLCKRVTLFQINFEANIDKILLTSSCFLVVLPFGTKIYCLRTGMFVKDLDLGDGNFSPHAWCKDKLLLQYKSGMKYNWKIYKYEMDMPGIKKAAKLSKFPFFKTQRKAF